MIETAIEFIDVSKGFASRNGLAQKVLDGVSFSIPAGKTTVIAGGSGQGKSVTLKLILGLLRADSGKILVGDVDVTSLRGRRLETMRTDFGVLFQGAALFDSMSVFDNVALPLRERTSLNPKEIEERVSERLASLDLDGHEEKFPAQLSGGMKKRVGLARALQLDPKIMLFDEPTTGLDPVMTHEIYELFARTQQKLGFTSVIVSHDIPRVFSLADQVIILHQGKIDVFNSLDEIQCSSKPHIKDFVDKMMGDAKQDFRPRPVE
jgi:phospholipid/cholesterol/gamma-HCH transport system ATP-binding protein